MPYKIIISICLTIALGSVIILSCSSPQQIQFKSRAESIPAGAVKISPAIDAIPPKLVSSEYKTPVPLDEGINTAGAEDSAFVLPDGKMIYFFFTPDCSIPAEKQLTDGATGIYVSQKQGNSWTQATRLILQDQNEVALDGCACARGDTLWFCSARKGNYRGVDMWIAQHKDGKWKWSNAGEKLNSEYQIGEMHITADGSRMYFHSARTGGQGGLDIWVTYRSGENWRQPENVSAVNSAEDEGWPFLTEDGKELWFTRTYLGSPAVFRSKRDGGNWGKPELIISQFAGEPSLDSAGNVYFTHHYFKDNKMIEADIYVAYRK